MYESSLWGMNIAVPWGQSPTNGSYQTNPGYWPYINTQYINPPDINGYLSLPW